jgi:hypothetical protein
MQNEWFIGFWFNQSSEVGLFDTGVNVRVSVVFKNSEPAVKSHIDTRWLDHAGVKGLNSHTLIIDFGEDVAVRKQHESEVIGSDHLARR